jgi:hypothetical protein
MFLKEIPNVTTESNSAQSLPLVALSHTPVDYEVQIVIRAGEFCQ